MKLEEGTCLDSELSVIAVWAQTRINAMLAAKTQGEVVVIASDLSGEISEWHHGQRSRG